MKKQPIPTKFHGSEMKVNRSSSALQRGSTTASPSSFPLFPQGGQP